MSPPKKKYVPDLPKEAKFVAAMAGSPANDATPLRVNLTEVPAKKQDDATYEHLTAVPFHRKPADSADCHLQIWELDQYDQARDVYLQKEETDRGTRENRLLAAFPGAVEWNADTRRYEFRVNGDPSLTKDTVDEMNGQVIVQLRPAGETDFKEYVVPMTEYESVFELAAVLRTEADDDDYASFEKAQPFPVQNIKATLWRQIAERGGITVGFVTDYPAGSTEYAAGEFVHQAEEMIASLPIISGAGGKVTLRPYMLQSRLDVVPALDEVRNKVQEFLEMEDPPKIGTLAFYGHGMPYGIQLDPANWSGPRSLRCSMVPPRHGDAPSCKAFVTAIADYVAPNLVIALFACSTGHRQPFAKGDVHDDTTYGAPFSCEELGGDSLAWTLCRELVRQGVTHPTVWAHTTAAHTTRNPRLRVFSPMGSADLVNLLVQMPCPSPETILAYVRRFSDLHPKAKPSTKMDWNHRANLIRAISEISAMYLPWAWSGGKDPDDSTPGYDEDAQKQAKALYDELSGEVKDPVALPDILVYEDDTRRYLTDVSADHDGPRLTEDFTLKQIVSGDSPFRVSRRLVGYLQMLLYRSRHLLAIKHKSERKLVVREILEDGDGLSIALDPDDEKTRGKVLAMAEAMVTEGLLTVAEALDDGIKIGAASVA